MTAAAEADGPLPSLIARAGGSAAVLVDDLVLRLGISGKQNGNKKTLRLFWPQGRGAIRLDIQNRLPNSSVQSQDAEGEGAIYHLAH